MTRGSRLSALGFGLLLATMLAAPARAQAPQSPPPAAQNRVRLEGEIRRMFARAVRERVGLSEEQVRRLAPLTQQHEQQRRELQQEERRARMALQAQLRSESPDTAAVSRLLDTLLEVQRRRIQLIEAEHRDLATVMSPVQRARYLAVQEQVRRRVDQMRQRAAGEGAGRPPGARRRPPP